MSKLTERQRLVLTVAVMVLLSGGLLALIFQDRGKIEEIEQEIAQLDERIRVADLEIEKTPEREDNALIFRAVEDRELAVLPTRQRIAAFHRNLSTFLSSANLSFRDLPESTPVESDLAKGIYVTRTVLSARGDSASLLKFVNMMENDPRLVAIKGLRVQAGQKSLTTPVAMVEHDIQVHLETYFYNPREGAVERVHIAGAEDRLRSDKIKEAIASFRPERPATYVLRPSTSRRDPLVDPREARPTLDPEELAEMWEREEVLVLDLESRIDDLNEQIEKQAAFIQTGDLFRSDRLAAEIDIQLNDIRARLSQVDQMKTVTIPDLALRVQKVRQRVDEVAARRPPRDLSVPRSVAEAQFDKIRAVFEAGDYAEVGSMASAWTHYIDDKEIEEGALAYVEGIAELRTRAKVLSEFHGITLRVTGSIVSEVDPAKSIVLVNGRPRRVGDAIDESGEVTVGAIHRDGVEFRYKGETVRVSRARPGEEDGDGGEGEGVSMLGARATLTPAR